MAYTNIDDPSAHFQTTLYTGNSTVNHSITNDGNSDMQPDLWWQINRDLGRGIYVADSSRGVTKYLTTFTTNADDTVSVYVTSFNSNGFTLSSGDTAVNNNAERFVTWNWKANGGTTASNSDGSITSTVQANQDAGFSIVTYTGTGSAATVGHGLGVAPKVVIVKARTGVPTSWAVFHKDGSTSDDDTFVLNSTAAKATYAGFWNNQYPSSSVFGISNDIWLNGNGVNFVAYCFAEKQGYSKFGSYIGNGNADGPFIYTGFKPAWIMVKDTQSSGDNWQILDTKRDPHNPQLKYVQADNSNAEGSFTFVDILSNGFKFRSTYSVGPNVSGHKTIYMAFAENPFVTSTGIPTTAR